MKQKITTTILTVIIAASLHQQASSQQKAIPVETGVSLQLAQYRHSVLSDIVYTLDFDIPADKNKLIDAAESVSFNLKSNTQDLQLDLKQPADHITSLKINGKEASVKLLNEHLLLGSHDLHTGKNEVSLQFKTGNQSFNRNDDYMYELNVPDHARTVFACFDQPDLKAYYNLTLRVSPEWRVLANAKLRDSSQVNGQAVYHFNTSDKLSTYLFSFAAGKFSVAKQMVGNREATFLYRETDPKKIRLSVDSVFNDHKNAIGFLEGWTGIPFPFQKVGFVGIPDFQFGGMEHPGEVQYQSSSLFLDEGATKDRFIARANLISHETSHMWFGDMVTMEWFNDVWMKEVFANFMADKVMEKVMGQETFNLKFLQDHYPAAYGVDRTAGANPIRQQLDNLQDAGSLYGNIIYNKAPVMMRQLELLMGKDQFQSGVREYLKRYAYGNATWPDLIAILSRHTKADLYTWNKVWVNQPGRPVFDYQVSYAESKIAKFIITQKPESGPQRIWPQFFDITLVYPDHSKTITANMNGAQIVLNEAKGLTRPDYIIFNSNGIGYGVFPVDKNTAVNLFSIKSPLQRASLYISAYENMLDGKYLKPAELLDLFTSGVAQETNETNLRLLTGYIGSIYWEFISKSARQKRAPQLEKTLWSAIQSQTAANNKKILFGAYQSIYLTPEAKSTIYTIWQTQRAPDGVKLTEDDYTSMALSIALKSDTITHVLQQQDARIKNIDRKKRLEFMMPALSLDVKERDAFFASLQDRKNRAKEAWVTSALGYLNNPLREETSEKYLQQSLEMVEDIQKTGDIFFPQNWLGAILGNYQDKHAAEVVRNFLAARPSYNPKLRAKILQSADNLFRATRLVQQ